MTEGLVRKFDSLVDWVEFYHRGTPPTSRRGPKTLSWLARETGISYTTIHAVATGRRRVSYETAQAIRKATDFEVSLSALGWE